MKPPGPSLGDAPTQGVEHPTATSRPAVPILDRKADSPDDDLWRLLSRRLRQVFVILAAIYLLFLIRQGVAYLGSKQFSDIQTMLLTVGFLIQATTATVAWFLWRSVGKWLQPAEWVSLGTLWLTQGLNQYLSLQRPDEIRLLLEGGDSGQVVCANTWMLPWFALIAGYPAMVPNKPRRTFIIVGITAIIPVLVTLLATFANSKLNIQNTWMMYIQYVLWGLVGGSISVYGSLQSALLRKQAFEARQFGQYRLIRKLDEGGMGEVFLAEHLLLRRPSVVKLIRPDRRTDPKVLKRFEREVRRLATLTHWNTVDVYDYGHTTDGTFYFAMEYLPGVNLRELVERYGVLPPARAVFLIRQVCRGLREAHAVKLIHRDIKPANMMACHRGGLYDVAKLLDFGLVRSPEDDGDGEDDVKLTREGAILGTPAFLSPEQACGTALDLRTDIYSLGCTLYFVLTGRAPFEKSTAMATVAAHIHEMPVPPTGQPEDLTAIVMKCLAKKPEDRFADVRELEIDLGNCSCAANWDHDRAEVWWKETGLPTGTAEHSAIGHTG